MSSDETVLVRTSAGRYHVAQRETLLPAVFPCNFDGDGSWALVDALEPDPEYGQLCDICFVPVPGENVPT